MLQAMQTYIHLLILRCKTLVGNTQTLGLHPGDAGCAIASLKVDRKVYHNLAQGERGSLVKNTDL